MSMFVFSEEKIIFSLFFSSEYKNLSIIEPYQPKFAPITFIQANLGNAASLSIRELLRLRLLFASLYHANWPFSPDCTCRMENNLYLETNCRGSKLSLSHYGVTTKFAATQWFHSVSASDLE